MPFYSFLLPTIATYEEESDVTALSKIFKKKGKALEKWRLKAMLVDTRKTKLTISFSTTSYHVPPWVYKKFVPAPSEKDR
ncbi:hypothetical protein KEJ15_02135 [Candidatus Bathyarchaeota archaeon]|nr:hypothetical protein [Candidatus Bathyarchaeota archaeon]